MIRAPKQHLRCALIGTFIPQRSRVDRLATDRCDSATQRCAWRTVLIFFQHRHSGREKSLRSLSPAVHAVIQTETADDFVLTQATTINSATFIGLLPSGAPLSSVARVEIELYHVFPVDSANPPSGNVLTRANSPSDVEIGSATRDSSGGSLSFTNLSLEPPASVSPTRWWNGINKAPNQFTGGEGPATGEEVSSISHLIRLWFLPADHYFFRPEVALANGHFLWLSAPKPIVSPGTPFTPDLQSWIRNDNLAPDWLRIGTDITGQGPFNAAFSLSGTVPEHQHHSALRPRPQWPGGDAVAAAVFGSLVRQSRSPGPVRCLPRGQVLFA